MKSLLSLSDTSQEEIGKLIELASAIKKSPQKYSTKLSGKMILMIFEKPSLRTRTSFDVAVKSLGGNTTILDTQNMPLGKESIEDTARVSSRYYDAIVARLFSHTDLEKLRDNATIPIINGLTNEHHPVQIISDLLTIKEKQGTLKGQKLCFLGDGNNNITHSLLEGCAMMGIDIAVGCPKEDMPNPAIVERAQMLAKKNRSTVQITNDPKQAIKNADIVYADSWMSYHVPKKEEQERKERFLPYQINQAIVQYAKKNYRFMNCLPAMRGYEQTAEIIDGEHSIVFDQAENRLHMQKAILLTLLP